MNKAATGQRLVNIPATARDDPRTRKTQQSRTARRFLSIHLVLVTGLKNGKIGYLMLLAEIIPMR